MRGYTAHAAQAPEQMDAEAIISLPHIPEANDMDHRVTLHYQRGNALFWPVCTKCTVQTRQASCERRDQLGMAAARKLERAEQEQAQTIAHPIAQEFRGMGIRLEDDVLLTDHGNEVLTQG